MNSEEHVFIRKALENVERAERYQRVKQIVVTVIAFAAILSWALLSSKSELNNFELCMIVCLGLAVCTAKIMSLINRNTRTVLRAIADLRQK